MQNCMPLLFLRLSCLSLIMPARSLARILGKKSWTKTLYIKRTNLPVFLPTNFTNFRVSECRAELVRAMPSAAENLKANFRASRKYWISENSCDLQGRHYLNALLFVYIREIRGQKIVICFCGLSSCILALFYSVFLRRFVICFCGFSSCILALFYSVFLWLAFLVCFI